MSTHWIYIVCALEIKCWARKTLFWKSNVSLIALFATWFFVLLGKARFWATAYFAGIPWLLQCRGSQYFSELDRAGVFWPSELITNVRRRGFDYRLGRWAFNYNQYYVVPILGLVVGVFLRELRFAPLLSLVKAHSPALSELSFIYC